MKRTGFLKLIRELLVVVAGILIAFGLNNWANNRSENKLAQRYLHGIHDDLTADSLQLSQRLTDLERREGLARRAIGFLYNPNAPGRDSAFTIIFRDLHFAQPFIPNASTYEALVSSGDLNLIDDFELRRAIAGHYHRYAEMEGENLRTEHFIRSSVSPYMMNEVAMADLRTGLELNFKDHRLQNIIFASFGILDLQHETVERTLQRCREILNNIEVYLED